MYKQYANVAVNLFQNKYEYIYVCLTDARIVSRGRICMNCTFINIGASNKQSCGMLCF